MADLNEMRELKNVVEHIMSDENLAKAMYKESDTLLNMRLHNAGLDAVRGEYDTSDIRAAKAAYYLNDLIHSILVFMEDGNESTITMDTEMYPDAEKPNWAAAEED